MMKKRIAVLLTCHNRMAKTILCLESLFRATLPDACKFDVFLTDDGSTDGTSLAVKQQFPMVTVIEGDGNLFWAGGMRLAWKRAMASNTYSAYLLINDDVKLHRDFILNLLKTEVHSLAVTGRQGIYSGATVESGTGNVTYGGSLITQNKFIMTSQKLDPGLIPQRCDLVNANVLWVSSSVVDEIGIFEERYTHGIADYDYALRASKHKIPVWLAPGICGVCDHDHGKNWKSGVGLKERINWMKSPKGLAYNEYLYYIKKHFPTYLPYSFIMLWMKTFFPFMWDKLKS